MKILVVTDRYPPYYAGGYELGCKDAADALRARGHDVMVLASTYGATRPMIDDDGVHRKLRADTESKAQNVAGLLWKEFINQREFTRAVKAFQPDIIYFWKLNRVSVSIALIAQQMGIPTSYYVFDRWIMSWDHDPWYALWSRRAWRKEARVVKPLLHSALRRFGLVHTDQVIDFSHAQMCSHYIKRYALEKGLIVADADVIHWGIDPDLFPYKPRSHTPERLLFVGRLVSHKGVHTTIEAMHRLTQNEHYPALELTIVGDTTPSPYMERLHALIRSGQLDQRVHFISFTDRDALPTIYQQHDILLFPSVWEEPFGITLLEAMASGLAVVGTGSGGSGEILRHGDTGLCFPPDDTEACAEHIKTLLDDPAYFESLRQQGRAAVENEFRLDTVIDKVEQSLERAVKS
ncbi:MAG: glycosyltransferase family 4 protein [Anaerolineae bacterium]|nr:glycosyltransferase family 4 protein [Anaerolineae bacterium]